MFVPSKISRYNGLDEQLWVFTTPRILDSMNFGFDMEPFQDNPDRFQPFVLESLVEIARESILGANNGGYAVITTESFPIFMCIEVNGKLCKLQSEELESFPLTEFPTRNHLKTFQRLIASGQITVEDLNGTEISDKIYRQLVLNQMCGKSLFNNAMIKLARILEENTKDKKLAPHYKKYKGTKQLKNWLKVAKQELN